MWPWNSDKAKHGTQKYTTRIITHTTNSPIYETVKGLEVITWLVTCPTNKTRIATHIAFIPIYGLAGPARDCRCKMPHPIEIYVYMYTCIQACTYISIIIYMYICARGYPYKTPHPIEIYVYMYIWIYIITCVYAHMYICIYVHVYICTYVCMHIRKYTHVCICALEYQCKTSHPVYI